MSEVEELKKALETAMGRIASLENERTRAPAQPPGINAHQLLLNPMGTLRGAGYNDEQLGHIRNAAIADFLGPNAPLPMQIAANSGAQLVAAQQASAAVADLSRRFDELSTAQKAKAKREEFKAISQLKDKYPNLSKAISANPDRYAAVLDAHGGTAEEFATAQEGQLTELLSALGAPQETAPTGSVNNPDNKDQSKKVVSAPLGSATNVVPPPPSAIGEQVGVWNKETYAKTKAAILSKVTTPK